MARIPFDRPRRGGRVPWAAARVPAVALGAAGVVVAGLPAGLPAGGPSASLAPPAVGWVATATQALAPVGATPLGPLPTSSRVEVTVVLRLRHEASLERLIAAAGTPGSPDFGEALSPSSFVASYGPTAAQVAAVESYLEQQGFTQLAVSSNRLMVSGTATAGEVDAAFDTELESFEQGGRTVYANVEGASVPAALGGVVGAVLGLNDVDVMHLLPLGSASGPPAPVSSSSATPDYPASYSPQGFWEAYDAGDVPAATGTTIAIFAEGDLSGVVRDLRLEEQVNRLPVVPVVVVPVGIPSSDTSGADEWDLDTQLSTGMAGAVGTLYVYDTTSLTDSDIAREFNAFAAADVARAGSASFGECEIEAYLDGSMLADDEAFAEAAAQGQTVFASSGDTGASCAVAPTNGVPDSGPPTVNYPASSPYVVAVGGTTLVTSADGRYEEELAWDAGGGGTSDLESAPLWQTGVVPGTAVGKGLPDVAMDADPESGATVYVAGTPETVGGTSLSSPLALGVWARAEAAQGGALGFAAPLLYALYRGGSCSTSYEEVCSSPAFREPVAGFNGAYPAWPGWNYDTGLGSLDVTALVRLLGAG